MKQQKWLIGLLAVGVIAIIGAPALKDTMLDMLLGNIGVIQEITDPIGPNREVVWEKGPVTADTSPQQRPPNVILILADDLGANDVTYGGGGVANGSVPTPNIDSIAREGVSFSNGYAANATCAPSRAALLTGRYPSRIGFVSTPAPAIFMKWAASRRKNDPYPSHYFEEREDEVPDYRAQGLPHDEITLAELLNDNGYHSVMLGKWHLGDKEGMRPGDHGFGEFLGILGGGSVYLPEDHPDVVNAKLSFDPVDITQWKAYSFHVTANDGKRFEPASYLTDYLTDEAVKVIEQNKNRPFFMYLAYNAPHSPLQAMPEDYAALAHIEDHTERVYGGMIRSLDRNVGRVLDSLKKNGLEENTLVIFASDNGGAGYLGLPDINKPYRGWKSTFFEGGINVPFFMKWPANIPRGIVYEKPVAQLDVFATVAAATGTPLPSGRKIDGVDLLPFVNGNIKGRPHETLFWDTGSYQAVIAGDWKLHHVNPVKAKPFRNHWLFNMKDDPTEQVNLADTRADKVNELQTILQAFNQNDKVKPLWPSLLEGPIRIDETINQSWEKEDEYVIWSN